MEMLKKCIFVAVVVCDMKMQSNLVPINFKDQGHSVTCSGFDISKTFLLEIT